MKKMIVLMMAGLFACGSAPTSRDSVSCCIVNGSTYCASASVEVQWDNMYWSTEDAGTCLSGQPCTAYASSPGDLQPIGNGTCE